MTIIIVNLIINIVVTIISKPASQEAQEARKACPTEAVCVPRPGLVIMLREVFVSKGSTSFLKSLCGKRLQRCLVDEVLPLKG